MMPCFLTLNHVRTVPILVVHAEVSVQRNSTSHAANPTGSCLIPKLPTKAQTQMLLQNMSVRAFAIASLPQRIHLLDINRQPGPNFA